MKLKFKHSGHLGSLIYSLAAVKVMTEKSGEPCDFFIPSDVPNLYPPTAHHPSGTVMVSEPIFRFIEPLLTHQSYIDQVNYGPLASIPRDVVDLDQFRTSGINLTAGFEPVCVSPVHGDARPGGKTMAYRERRAATATRTPRSLSAGRCAITTLRINYALLQPFESVGFVGLPEEYGHFVERHALTNVGHLSWTMRSRWRALWAQVSSSSAISHSALQLRKE